MTAKRNEGTADEPPAEGVLESAPRTSGAAALAEAILQGTADPGLSHYARALGDSDKATASIAARVVEAVAKTRPGLVTPHTERLIAALGSPHGPVARACADTLPELARTAPARIAKHSEGLQAAWQGAGDVGRDGIVRTWVALCAASIAYQPRLVDAIAGALDRAELKALARWALLALPVLKGEPHAQARAIVERRIGELPKPAATKLAAELGIKLRVSRPG